MKRPVLISLLCLLLAAQQALGAPGGTLAERYRNAQTALQAQRLNEDKTRAERDRLESEARDLQERLIANAAKVQQLEAASETTAAELARMNGAINRLQADLVRDRDRVAHLLAVLQRLQTEEPPALVLRPDDSLAAARGMMQMGAMLPPVYRETADLAKRLKILAEAKVAMATRAATARKEAGTLKAAREGLDRLLEEKSLEQAGADGQTIGTPWDH